MTAVLSTDFPEPIQLLSQNNIQMWQGVITPQELDVSRLEIREYEIYGFFHLLLSYSTLIHEVWYFSPCIIWFSSLKQWKTNSAKEFIVFHLFRELNQFFKGLQRCLREKEKDCKAWSREGNGGSRTAFLGGTNLVHEFRHVSCYLLFLIRCSTTSIFPKSCCPWDCAGQGMENLLRLVLLM